MNVSEQAVVGRARAFQGWLECVRRGRAAGGMTGIAGSQWYIRDSAREHASESL